MTLLSWKKKYFLSFAHSLWFFEGVFHLYFFFVFYQVDDQWIYALNTRTGGSGIVPIVFLNIKVPLVPTQKTDFVSNAIPSYSR